MLISDSMTDQDMGDYNPKTMDELDPELKRKKKRRRIIIIILIVVGVLVGIAAIVIVALLLFTEALANACANACGEACEQSCNNACNNSDMVSANIGDPNFNAHDYISFTWETLKDWLHNFF